jgi:hypothetical protein
MLLNKDGLLAGRKIEKGENDFTFTYSRLYDKEAFLLHYPIVDLRAMNGTLTDFKDRALTLLFNGKNPDFVVPELLSTPLVMMTRQWPDIETTYKFLREAKVLYSSDCWTALLNQALILGCAPVISAWQGFSLEECLLSETPEVFELNKESDFTEANLFKKKLSFLKRVAEYRDNFPGRVGNLMKAIEKHFNSRILQVA